MLVGAAKFVSLIRKAVPLTCSQLGTSLLIVLTIFRTRKVANSMVICAVQRIQLDNEQLKD